MHFSEVSLLRGEILRYPSLKCLLQPQNNGAVSPHLDSTFLSYPFLFTSLALSFSHPCVFFFCFLVPYIYYFHSIPSFLPSSTDSLHHSCSVILGFASFCTFSLPYYRSHSLCCKAIFLPRSRTPSVKL